MFKFQKILSAGVAAAVTMTALASGVCKIDKRSGHTEVLSGKYRLVTSNAKGNFAVSAFSVDGKEYFAHLPDPGLALVDGCHPSDFGFYLMYEKVLPVLKKALGL